jgi:hypothetical protein
MANTTFSGPVRSLNGFISFGPKAVVSLTANATLTDMDIKTDGTDRFFGGLYIGANNATGKTFISTSATNDVITQNGTTKGGLAGGWLQITAIASAAYYVKGTLLGSSTLVTPFADA